MKSTNNINPIIDNRQDIKRRVSYKKKIASDFRRQKDILDLYSDYWLDSSHGEEIEKYKINYDLFNGRLDVKLYDEPLCIVIDKEKVRLDDLTITHYPLLSSYSHVILGEQIQRPFKPVAKDTGEFSQTLRNKKFNELLRELINNDIINPIVDEVNNAFINLQGSQMSQEQVAQIQKEIDNRIKSKTPEEVIDFMANDFRTPTQRQAQQLLNHFVEHAHLKAVDNDGFKHALPTGVECYFVGDRHEEPIMELCNPMGLRFGGSKNSEWIQDGAWVAYEQWITVEEALQKHAEALAGLSDKQLAGLIDPIGVKSNGGASNPHNDHVQRTMMIDLSEEGSALAEKYKDVNYKTKRGQNQISQLYSDVIKKYGLTYGHNWADYGVREVHVCWRDQRLMKRVTRLVDGEEKRFWFDEHYEEKPEDIKVIEIWVDEIWEGTKIGTSIADALYLNIRPVPGQFSSKYNPFGTKLPYYGKKYNTHMGNSKNIAWMDPGKPWQKEYDVTMAQIKHELKTDMGKMFLMYLEMKPEGWDYKQWLNTGKNTKLLFSTLKRHGGIIDPNMLRPVDLSKASDIASKLQFLEYCRANMVQSLNLNDARIGAIGEYSTNQNVQQSQIASYNQTESYFETHRQIVERALNAFMNRAKMLYKTNNKRFFILDDVTRTELEISPDFWYEESAIEFSTSSDEVNKVRELKMQTQPLIQNGMSFEGVLALALADTTSDIIDIMKKESKRMENIRQEQMQIQQQQFQAQMQSQQQQADADRQMNAQLKSAELQQKDLASQRGSLMFQKQADADADGQSDMLEKAEMELTIKKLIEDRKADLKLLEIQTNAGLKNKDIDTKKQIAKEKPVKPATTSKK